MFCYDSFFFHVFMSDCAMKTVLWELQLTVTALFGNVGGVGVAGMVYLVHI